MRKHLIKSLQSEIENNLRSYLRDEGIELCINSNEALSINSVPSIILESIEHLSLEPARLLSKIRIILGILGKPWQCEALVNGIYQTLQPHNITLNELTVLLMSLHVETIHGTRLRTYRKQAIISYIIEENA